MFQYHPKIYTTTVTALACGLGAALARALNPAPYHNLGARRAQPTQAPHSTGSDRPQPQHEAPRPPNGPNPLKKDHFFCARGMNQRVGRGRQFLQYSYT